MGIPRNGAASVHRVNDCGKSKVDGPPYYKCTDCYMAWYEFTSSSLRCVGLVKCHNCKRTFTTVEEFSDYKRF